jgi:SAM-dependent methyltransferase
MTDPRQHSPAAARNRGPIVAILRDALPTAGLMLEIASGTGEHVMHFAREMQNLDWQPSDPNPAARASIAAYVTGEGLANVRPPIALDAAAEAWPIDRADAVLCINMVHISPWESTLGLMRGAAAILPPGGLLYLYGPYRRAGIETAPSNLAFDLDLQRRDPRWGLRDLEAVVEVAAAQGLTLERVIAMPANNLSVLLRA